MRAKKGWSLSKVVPTTIKAMVQQISSKRIMADKGKNLTKRLFIAVH
jgi:hypothetical protein